jgi:DNA-binding protein HU-beta
VTRADLVVRMAAAAGWSRAATDRAMRAMLASIGSALEQGESVTLVGFGTFAAARRKPRTLTNPRPGRRVEGSGRAPRFKPSKELKQAIR